ncbi:SCO0930 family lipoprotein [Streptomyces sp. NBC_01352]|uniref:SCO0930 family lipoprotein n=1 Tax=Streptomyces plumbiresistens TaxID=511811 RepID=A0ABP7S929_9ACTN|nr:MULTISPECIES: SCO0930 family lipoprotein [unclassified Streptomyces]MCX4705252.1 SCO0930 family lipoprotein [Streptomyces sp. NBC_01373]
MKTSWRSASLVASAAAVLALTTACGQEGGTPSTGSQNVGATAAAGDYTVGGIGTGTASGTSTPEAGQGAAAQASTAGELNVSTNAELGNVLTDSAGLTLYRFDEDTAEPPKSNCSGDCATAWPPVPADDAEAGAGVDASQLGEVTRADGTKQLTIGGWPAYRFAKDTKAGDVAGQGVGGKWYALAPDGKKAKNAAAADLPGLSTRKDPKLGEIVIDKDGHTVYRFMKDTQWPMSTKCTGDCLDKWPVVAPVDANDTKGIDLQGSTPNRGYVVFDRPDGIKQQSIDCVPIYTFAGDKKPGDTNGQGVGGTWYAVAPDGKPVGAPGQ